jgi:hypothetical protein
MSSFVENLREEAQVLLQLEQSLLNQMTDHGIFDKPDENIQQLDNTCNIFG